MLFDAHASALIAKGLDVVQISRRLGDGTPVITLRTYAHLFSAVDSSLQPPLTACFASQETGDRVVSVPSGANFWVLFHPNGLLSH
jgi:hypothetical protein